MKNAISLDAGYRRVRKINDQHTSIENAASPTTIRMAALMSSWLKVAPGKAWSMVMIVYPNYFFSSADNAASNINVVMYFPFVYMVYDLKV